MIPDFKKLRRRCLRHNIKIEESPFFKEADEFVRLTKKFNSESPLQKISLWIDMIFYPIYIFYKACMLQFSPMYSISLMKSYQLWFSWFRYQVLIENVRMWTQTVRLMGGPWISTNDSEYHIFVYADGMQRLLSSRTEELTKSTE
jgi:hypothetical protein